MSTRKMAIRVSHATSSAGSKGGDVRASAQKLKPRPTTRDLIAKAGPVVVTPRILSIGNWLLVGAAGLCFVVILLGGLILLHPSLKGSLGYGITITYLLAISLLAGWGAISILVLASLLGQPNSLQADQLDAQAVQDQKLIDLLAGSFALPDLQRLGRQVAFEIRMTERFSTTVALASGLAAAITATAAALPSSSAQIADWLKVAIPALLLCATIAGALRHSFGQRLLRLGFAISEAERALGLAEGKAA